MMSSRQAFELENLIFIFIVDCESVRYRLKAESQW